MNTSSLQFALQTPSSTLWQVISDDAQIANESSRVFPLLAFLRRAVFFILVSSLSSHLQSGANQRVEQKSVVREGTVEGREQGRL